MRSVVLLHGFTGSPRSWHRVTEALGEPLALAPALVGHAGSEAGGVESFDDELERLASLIRALPSRPLHLAGYSLGARLGLGLLLRHPELFASATLVGVHPGLAQSTERAARRLTDGAWCELLEARGITAFVDAWQAQALFSSEARLSRAERHAQRKIRLSHSASGLCRSLRTTGLGQMPSYGARLGELGMPVTLLCGQLDSKFRELATALVSSLSGGTLEVVPDAGHNLLMERPDVVAGAIARGART